MVDILFIQSLVLDKINFLIKRIINKGGRSQNLILFIRGKAILGDPNIKGINQFPNPPIKNGITIKKIIKNSWLITIVL